MLTGSLETFTSSEVLRLVAGTRKTGLLAIRGAGPLGEPIAVEVTVRDGSVVDASGGTPLAYDTTTSLADMLRISDGEFSFSADDTVGYGNPAVDVDAAIADADAVMAEWQLLESYVPTLDAAVEMTASIPAAVTLQPSHWTTLSAVGTGCSARELARLTGESPLQVCRNIRSLVDLGVVRVYAVEPAVEPDLEERTPERSLSVVADADTRELPLGPDSADLVSAPDVEVPEVAERFRHFSARAAAAMTVTDSGGAHLASAGDEAVSRNLLLKFLASARQPA